MIILFILGLTNWNFGLLRVYALMVLVSFMDISITDIHIYKVKTQ